jgi:hypothetical protein
MITESDMLTEAKKMAVEMMFWPACPVDDDYCFDAIMYTSVIDRKFEDEHCQRLGNQNSGNEI